MYSELLRFIIVQLMKSRVVQSHSKPRAHRDRSRLWPVTARPILKSDGMKDVEESDYWSTRSTPPARNERVFFS